MKFLLIVLAIRFVFFLLYKSESSNAVDVNEYDEDWNNPSEHNVWW